jgi:Zn-dependent protease with chaperone function
LVLVVVVPLVSVVVAAQTADAALRNIGAAALALGATLMLGIVAAAVLVRRRRAALPVIFVPGMRLALGGLFLLITVDAVALVWTVVRAVEWVSGRSVHIAFTACLMLAAGAVAGVLLGAGLTLSRRLSMLVIGHLVPVDSTSALAQMVNRLADQIEARRPTSIVLGLEPAFYATSAEVVVHPERRVCRGHTLHLSLPLMRMLNNPELAAVIGHELGHFRGRDTRYAQQFHPVYTVTSRALETIDATCLGHMRRMAMMPAAAILSFYLERFADAEAALRRERELAADRAGAMVSSARHLACALVKIGAFAPLWTQVREAVAADVPPMNASELFAAQAVASTAGADLDRVLEACARHPTDTHPSTIARLEALGLDAREIAIRALDLVVGRSSIDLVENAEQIERRLTWAEHRVLRAAAEG